MDILPVLLLIVIFNRSDVLGDYRSPSEKCFGVTQRPPEVPKRLLRENGKKKIVWVDTLHNGHGMRRSIDYAMFDQCAGPASNCEILRHVIVKPQQSQSETIGPLVDADAIIMQGCHMGPIPRVIRRDPSQIFILAERENWLGTRAYLNVMYNNVFTSFQKHMGIFNWTMHYRLDADIFLPYGFLMKSEMPVKPRNYRAIYDRKSKDVVWFVSHCDTPSLREYYVHEMRKYINVDIYGQCGTHTCPKHDTNCLKSVVRDYKFYLSFENTYYPNYVTEKLFDWFPRDIIQVVRGGGIDYSFYGVPKRSIVDADDFQSAADLAKFLVQLGENRDLYAEYLQNKAGYFSVPHGFIQQQAYCNLCAMLQDVNKHRKTYTHIAGWLSTYLFQEEYCPEDPSKLAGMNRFKTDGNSQETNSTSYELY